MSQRLGPPWPSPRPTHRGRTVRELIEEIAEDVDQPWCFLGAEDPRRDTDPRRVPRPDAGPERSRG